MQSRWLLLLIAGWAIGSSGAELSLNLFRNPSIGAEIRQGAFSVHTGYYPTILAEGANVPSRTSTFWRTGVSYWPIDWGYVSLSHLYGISGAAPGHHLLIIDAGAELVLWKHVALRLGVAYLPFSPIGGRVNPTPGIGIRVPLSFGGVQ